MAISLAVDLVIPEFSKKSFALFLHIDAADIDVHRRDLEAGHGFDGGMDALLNVFGQIQHAVAVLGDEAALNADLIVIVLAQADALGDALFAEPVGEFAALDIFSLSGRLSLFFSADEGTVKGRNHSAGKMYDGNAVMQGNAFADGLAADGQARHKRGHADLEHVGPGKGKVLQQSDGDDRCGRTRDDSKSCCESCWPWILMSCTPS